MPASERDHRRTEIHTRPQLLLGAATTALTLVVGPVLLAVPAQAAPCSPTITTDGAATVVSFTNVGSCTWTVPTDITILDAVLIVGGGGGGGFDIGGGGGAGGLVDRTNLAVTPGIDITVVVGAGGAGATNYTPSAGTNSGGNSSFDSVVALGGGFGGSGSVNGANGGSGGGAGYAAGAARNGGSALQPGSAASGSGFAGGASPNYGYLVDTGGGGGGAGAVGVDSFRNIAVGDFGGPGGAGVSRTITGSSLFYAGGGGGGGAATVAAGGSGVGGNGGTTFASATPNLSPTAGAANTGSGGGGGKNGGAGAAGAAGIVILRYGAPSPAARAETPPPSWFQSVGRAHQDDPCDVGWAPSWAEWMNNRLGGWVCNREIYWNSSAGEWLSRS